MKEHWKKLLGSDSKTVKKVKFSDSVKDKSIIKSSKINSRNIKSKKQHIASALPKVINKFDKDLNDEESNYFNMMEDGSSDSDDDRSGLDNNLIINDDEINSSGESDIEALVSLNEIKKLNKLQKDRKSGVATATDSPTSLLATPAPINKLRIQQKLEEIQYKVPKGFKRVPWIETLCLVNSRFIESEKSTAEDGKAGANGSKNSDSVQLMNSNEAIGTDREVKDNKKSEPITIDVTDDIKREAYFQDQTLISVNEALARLQAIGLPFSKPLDYFAEMLKTDTHMGKVQSKIDHEKVRVEGIKQRKKQKVEKKFAKSVRVARRKDKQMEKNKNLKKIDEWKKSKFKKPLD